MSTPHIAAEFGDFAKTVLMPGDPLRAKYIADNLLESARLVSDIRGMYAYTGQYDGKQVSVMASGMGMPSMGIYSYELFSSFGVENIIRIGTAGAVSSKLGLRDIVLVQASATNSSYSSQYRLPGNYPPCADFGLLDLAHSTALKLNKKAYTGTVFCTDFFYDDSASLIEWRKMGVLATEMESAALYLNAARLGKKALCICTISDCPLTGESCSAQERQNGFVDMMELALETAAQL